MAGGDCLHGGIWRLLELIEEHRAAVEYDWRTRFGMSIDDMPDRMGWDEAGRLASLLCRDPSSALFAALAGWEYPMSREALLLADLFDLEHTAHADPKRGRPKPHPMRPVKQVGERTRVGNPGGRSDEEIVAILRRLGHRL